MVKVFELLDKFVEKIVATVGASRAAVDALHVLTR
jgi:electron transfer flavoprotein alpha subunit|tara:strand:- start:35 stop:139 length:105 start_codon:yes stop_codon:yes gene_type:complete